MTLVALALREDGFELAQDTVVRLGDTPFAFSFKPVLLPLYRAAIGCRGPTILGDLVGTRLGRTFMSCIEDALPVIVRTVAEHIERLRAEGRPDRQLGWEMYLAGWSPRHGRYAGWYIGTDTAEPVELAPGFYFKPGGTDSPPPWVSVFPKPVTMAAGMAAVVAVKAAMEAAGDDDIFGAEVWCVACKDAGMTIRRAHTFADLAALRAQMEAANGPA